MTEQNQTTETNQETTEEYYTYKGKDGEYKLPAGFKNEMNTRLSVERSKVEESWKQQLEEVSKVKAEIESKYQELYKST